MLLGGNGRKLRIQGIRAVLVSGVGKAKAEIWLLIKIPVPNMAIMRKKFPYIFPHRPTGTQRFPPKDF